MAVTVGGLTEVVHTPSGTVHLTPEMASLLAGKSPSDVDDIAAIVKKDAIRLAKMVEKEFESLEIERKKYEASNVFASARGAAKTSTGFATMKKEAEKMSRLYGD